MVCDRGHDAFDVLHLICQIGVMNMVFGQEGALRLQIIKLVQVYHVTRQTPSTQSNIYELLLFQLVIEVLCLFIDKHDSRSR